jgi:poly(A) polymerase
MNPVVIDRSQHTISRRKISPEALEVLNRLREGGFLAYLAGGGVRDLLLGRQPKDFDIATDAHPNQVKRLFRNCRLIGRRFRLAHVMFRNTYIEVATFRAHLPTDAQPVPEHLFQKRDGVIARDNVFGTPPEDAVRRDFTVNALFYNIADRSIIDYVGGLKDLDSRVIRVIGDPRVKFREDPVRMIRAIRFASALDFAIEDVAWQAMTELKDTIALSSRDRLYEESIKLLFCGRAEAAVEKLAGAGLFDVLFPVMGAWLKTPEGAEGQKGLSKALRQIDIWKKAGMIPGDALLWSLLFGAYHEWGAARLVKDGWPRQKALGEAVFAHLANPANCVRIPKRVIIETAQIMAVQPSFERTQGKRAERFRRHHCFNDALVYLKWASGLTGKNKDLLHTWMTMSRS